MIKAVLFDMDGVLVDTEWFYNCRRCAYLETKGYTFDEIPDLSGTNDVYIWEFFEPNDAERRAELKREYFATYMKEHPVPYDELKNPDARPVMEELRRRGVLCAIASSGQREMIEELVGAADLRDVLDATVSGHEVSAFKPDPAVYLRTMELLGVEPRECLVVEDSPLGIEAGLRSGARVLALKPREGVTLDQSQAHRVIDTLWDVIEEIDS